MPGSCGRVPLFSSKFISSIPVDSAYDYAAMSLSATWRPAPSVVNHRRLSPTIVSFHSLTFGVFPGLLPTSNPFFHCSSVTSASVLCLASL